MIQIVTQNQIDIIKKRKGIIIKRTILITTISFVGIIALILILLPQILNWIGFHPDYDRAEYDLEGRRAPIIATNHDTLGDTGKATGVYGSELTIAYYEFLDAGMTVDIAIIANGLMLVFAGRDGHWTWWGLLIGILYILFGIFVIAHALVTIGALVLIFAFWALIAGILAIVLAFRLRGLAKYVHFRGNEGLADMDESRGTQKGKHKLMWKNVNLLIIVLLLTGCSSVPKDAPCIEGVDVEIMTTEGGVEFVRTPDTCFENLSDWSYEPQYVEIDGLRQAYVDVGSGESGETILLLHGQPSWSYLYRKMIPVLEGAGHRVIAMDHLGMGRSDKPIDPDYYTYQGHVDRLEAFIQELELDEAKLTIFVQDWGSLIGLQVVGTHPDWFDRLVVGNGFLPTFQEGMTPFPLPENPRITRNLFHQAILKLPAQQEPIDWEKSPPSLGVETDLNYFSLWIDYARNDERFRPEVFVEAQTYYDLTPEEEQAYVAPFPSRIFMGGVRAFPGLINQLPGVTDSGWAGLGEFTNPFLTIWGNNDGGNLGNPVIQQTLIDHIPGSAGWDHVRLPDASHFLQDDQGEETARRVNEFIGVTSQD